jgi:AcrR family transcriptional regulator
VKKRLTQTEPEGSKPTGPRADRVAAYLDLGRRNQKLRTREALVAVASDLLRKGQALSVAEVADAARVSRSTAYRYFPTSEMLGAQAMVAAVNAVEMEHVARIAAGLDSPAEKLDAIISGSHAMTMAHEAEFRSLLRFTVEINTKVDHVLPRAPIRRAWIEEALSSLKNDLGRRRFNRLTAALSLFCGIEPVVVLNDIFGMAPQEAREVKRWAAQQLLRAAIGEVAQDASGAPDPSPKRQSASKSSGRAPEQGSAPQVRPRSSARRV